MCKAMEDMRNEAIRECSIDHAKKMLKIVKMTFEEIAECSGLTIEKIEHLVTNKRNCLIW